VVDLAESIVIVVVGNKEWPVGTIPAVTRTAFW
jgi:hypothetical protein